MHAAINTCRLVAREILMLLLRLPLPPCRFSCPVQIGNSYRVAYVKARGHTCFDHNYYVTMAPDLKILPSPYDLWLHYAGFGQFENRQIRWVAHTRTQCCRALYVPIPCTGVSAC
jgi:hypothetical protein